MQREEIERIIAKYRKLAGSLCCTNEEKSSRYDEFADYIADEYNIERYEEEDDDYETEQDLWDDYNEAVSSEEAAWELMFPNGDDDDAITDYVTK
ncbi:MAG: hypothetical protein LBR10_01180 [Prevotellaceae bacterium]|jgi:hypothetical protein|nr:hypothetical protein [Prevotellaceae bacterium]